MVRVFRQTSGGTLRRACIAGLLLLLSGGGALADGPDAAQLSQTASRSETGRVLASAFTYPFTPGGLAGQFGGTYERHSVAAFTNAGVSASISRPFDLGGGRSVAFGIDLQHTRYPEAATQMTSVAPFVSWTMVEGGGSSTGVKLSVERNMATVYGQSYDAVTLSLNRSFTLHGATITADLSAAARRHPETSERDYDYGASIAAQIPLTERLAVSVSAGFSDAIADLHLSGRPLRQEVRQWNTRLSLDFQPPAFGGRAAVSTYYAYEEGLTSTGVETGGDEAGIILRWSL